MVAGDLLRLVTSFGGRPAELHNRGETEDLGTEVVVPVLTEDGGGQNCVFTFPADSLSAAFRLALSQNAPVIRNRPGYLI